MKDMLPLNSQMWRSVADEAGLEDSVGRMTDFEHPDRESVDMSIEATQFASLG